ncbi:MAG: ATP-binding protein [Desulfobacterales bacterium]
MKSLFHKKSKNLPPGTSIPWGVYSLIVLIGMLITGIAGYGFYTEEKMNTVFMPLVNDATAARQEAKIAGMMFEETISTGIVWDFEANWNSLDREVRQLRTRLDKARSPGLIFLPFYISSEQLKIEDIESKLAGLKKLAKERMLNKGGSILNFDTNQQYRKVYTEMLSLLNNMEIRLRLLTKENLIRFRYTQIFLLCACFLLSVAACFMFFIFERRRAHDLSSLFQAKEVIAKEMLARKQTETELVERSKELERSNRDLEQFSYIISHDLQEPLRMITSYIQLLTRRYKSKIDADAEEFFGFVTDGASRMQMMIKALLDYSRVGTRAKPLSLVKPGNIVDLVLENLRVSIDESRAAITCDPLPMVLADESQLIQLFQNLISNAIKFAGQLPPCIHISAVEKSGNWVFSVKDNGIGIDPGFYERIFTIFQRLHTIAEYPGTGIGLSVCRKIVERHGGRIWVSSVPNEGATFFFTLSAEGSMQNVNL